MDKDTDWATLVAQKAEMKSRLFELYDTSIQEGFTRDEAIAIVQGGVLSSRAPMLWPLYKLWLDQERPGSTST